MGISSKEIKIKNENPGPGNYNLNLKTSGPSFKIKEDNTKYAHDKFMNNTHITPSGGNYNPKHEIKYQNISYSMTSKPKGRKENNFPGPGAYENIHKKSTSPLFS